MSQLYLNYCISKHKCGPKAKEHIQNLGFQIQNLKQQNIIIKIKTFLGHNPIQFVTFIMLLTQSDVLASSEAQGALWIILRT